MLPALWVCPKTFAGTDVDERKRWNGKIGLSLHVALYPLKALHITMTIITITVGTERMNDTLRGR